MSLIPRVGVGPFASSGLHFEVTDRADDGILDAFYPAYDAAFVLDNEKERIEGFRDCLALNHGATHDALMRRYGPFRELLVIARERPKGPVLGGANFLVSMVPRDISASIDHTLNLNYLFVVARQRGRGLSSHILRACVDLAAQVAHSRGGSLASSRGLAFLEINDPFRLSQEQYRVDSEHSGIDQVARLAYWARVGAAVLDWPYVQPALSAGQADDTTLAYAALAWPDRTLPARLVACHLERFFAISVLKGAPLSSSQSAVSQLAQLTSDSDSGQQIALLELSSGLPLLTSQLQRMGPDRPGSLPQALREAGQ